MVYNEGGSNKHEHVFNWICQLHLSRTQGQLQKHPFVFCLLDPHCGRWQPQYPSKYQMIHVIWPTLKRAVCKHEAECWYWLGSAFFRVDQGLLPKPTKVDETVVPLAAPVETVATAQWYLDWWNGQHVRWGAKRQRRSRWKNVCWSVVGWQSKHRPLILIELLAPQGWQGLGCKCWTLR